ncbi:hypothetical protein DH2020_039027 [Rehmannia glutinosa]|uniref:tetrahydrofolate synthase n=1 Tax=Rehmannia glutinosa TaxID=99300 RepID=A0ABR0UXL7_REHGL
MLIYKIHYLRPELVGVSDFHLRERLFSSKLRWTFSCLPACMNALDLSGMKSPQSLVKIGHKGFRDKKFSSQLPQLMDSDLMIEENTEKYHHHAYEIAMEALSSLISRKKRGDSCAVGGKYKKLERMLMYIEILGLEEHISDLKIIHVAGTKGKGSTCTFCEAILRDCGFKTGLFTSPHLIDVRERFRLDGARGKHYVQAKAAHVNKENWKRFRMEIPDLSHSPLAGSLHWLGTGSYLTQWKAAVSRFFYDYLFCFLYENVTDDLPMPPLFQFLTVLALKIFACEKVDVAIIEVGLGGTKDSTNVIKDPVVCGVSPLGMDHMEALGNTLGQIASHKAGIFKPQVPAFTVPQLSEAMDVLQEKADALKVPLEVVPPLDRKKLNGLQLSLSGDHQFTNAGLAVALCKSWLQTTGNWEKLFQHANLENNMPDAFLRGLSTARLSGRAQIVYDTSFTASDKSSGELIFYLDGAHSPESMEVCARWFSSAVKEGENQSSISSLCPPFQTVREICSNGHVQPVKNDSDKISKQILLFNCMDVRDPQILLATLVNTCATSGTYFSKAIFVPSISTYNKITSGSSAIPLDVPSKDLSWQFNLHKVWEKIIHGKENLCESFEMEIPESIQPHTFMHDDVSNCGPTDGRFSCSAVVSSLPLTINWLRDYIKENPSLRIQVLVTGSLHLVGDVLKLLQI